VPTVHLVDASPYIFRAFFAVPRRTRTPDGRPAGAIYGFTAFLRKLIADEAVSHLGVAFDGSLTTSFRNDLYPAYKAQREAPPAELEEQIEGCVEAARELGAAVFLEDRYEADDLIGTLAGELATAGCRVVIVSSDKDLAQLVGGAVELLDVARGRRYGPADVRERFGVEPAQMVDLLALAGDSVDNIPGVRGVGRKTAVALLGHFGDLDALYGRLAEVPELPIRGARALGERLAAGRERAALSRRLAAIVRDAPVTARLPELELDGAGRDAGSRRRRA